MAEPNEGAGSDRFLLKNDAFMRLRGADSLVVLFAGLLSNLLLGVAPLTYLRHWKFPEWRNDPHRIRYTKLAVELWTFFLLGLETFILFVAVRPGGPWIWPALAIWGLVDVFGATLRDLVIASSLHRDEEGPYILVQDPIRWMLMVPLTLLQVVLCHGILFLSAGARFGPHPITDPVSALYQSLVTFTSLGYGDYIPNAGDTVAKLIVISELSFFLLFLAIKLPLALSIVRVRGGGTGAFAQPQPEPEPAEPEAR